MGKFLKESGGYELYKNVEVTWIKGHNPDLFIFDQNTNEEIEKVDLGRMKYTELHTFFEKKFGKKIESKQAVSAKAAIDDKKKDLNEIERAKMNKEIFEGVDDDKLDTSSMSISRAIYIFIFLLGFLFIFYAMTFNPSLIKRISSLCGCREYFGSKATV